MRIGVVIPTLNEEAVLPSALDALLPQSPDDVIVVDGGSTDGTRQAAQGRARWVDSPPGRARQLNAGARALDTEALLFLHADCILGEGSLAEIRRVLQDPAVVGGGFHKRFRSTHPLLRHGSRVRSHLWHGFGYVLGDQAQFVRRSAFARLGGFREDVPAEDMDLSWRMGLEGRWLLLEREALLSARRLEHQGVVTTWGRWWLTALAQGLRAAWEGPRQGALNSVKPVSSGPTTSRGSSGTG